MTGCASASARNPAISAGLYGALACSRGSLASAGASAGTTRRAVNRRFVRSVRRAEPDRPGAVTANRSITDGCSSTSGTASRPSAMPNAASRAAAHSSAFARARVGGAAAAATCRAKPAASAGTEAGRQPAIYPATPGSGTRMDASQRNLSTGIYCGHPEPPRI
jgi:hypothetical protein